MSPSGEEVAAILLRSLPTELAEKLLARFDPERAARLRTRMQALGNVTPNQLEQALQTFATLQNQTNQPRLDVTVSDQGVSKNTANSNKQDKPEEPEPEQETKRIRIRKLTKLVVPQEPESILILREIEVDRLVPVLIDEQDSTVALILSVLNPQVGADIIKRMPPERRPDIAVRLSQPGMKNRALLDQLAQAVIDKVVKMATTPQEPSQDERIQNLATMLRGLPRADRIQILEVMEQNNAETANQVKERLYQFDDVLRIDDRALQGVLVELDMKTLALALKGADENVSKKISNNMSSRAREMLGEEIGLLGSVPGSRVKEAQNKVVGLLRKFEEEGKIVIET